MIKQVAKLNYLRMAPRKVRLVAATLKGLSANEAEARLLHMPQRAAKPLIKLLRSAVHSASYNQKALPQNLFVESVRIDGGPMLKRYLPRARGSASEIQKKTSHITLVLGEYSTTKTDKYTIVQPSKKVKTEKIKKASKEKPVIEEHKNIKKVEKPGFFNRVFRRKSI